MPDASPPPTFEHVSHMLAWEERTDTHAHTHDCMIPTSTKHHSQPSSPAPALPLVAAAPPTPPSLPPPLQGDRLEEDWVPEADDRPAEEVEKEAAAAEAKNRCAHAVLAAGVRVGAAVREGGIACWGRLVE